ncbi:MAG: ECF transporter S component [Clostridiales bacterium]|jgi:uncharacterized membrane protein|nr:ECF transporter S component [Clostridiales bacterium]
MPIKKFKLTNRQIAMLAIFLGLMILFTFAIPALAFPPIIPGVLSAAFVFLLIVGVAALSEGLFTGVAVSTMFGITSLVSSFVFPVALSVCFHNPLISVLPRIFMGVVVFYTYKGLNKLIKNPAQNKWLGWLKIGIAAAAGALYNTVSVMGMIAIFYGGRDIAGTVISLNFILLVVATAGVAEFLVCLLLAPPIVSAINRFKRHSAVNAVAPSAKEQSKTEEPKPPIIDNEPTACVDCGAADFSEKKGDA